MELLLKIIYVTVFAINFTTALIIIIKGSSKKIGLLFLLLITILNGWVVSDFYSYTANLSAATLGARFSYMFGSLIVPTFLLFVYHFPKRSNFSQKYILFSFIPAVIIGYFSFSEFFVKKMVVVDSGLNLLETGKFHWLFSLFVATLVAGYLYVLWKKIHQMPPIDRLRLKYVLMGFIVASSIGIFLDLILQPILVTSFAGALGSAGTVFISLAVGYAVLKYRLFDITIIIKEGLVHFFSSAMVLFFYIYLLVMSRDYLSREYDWSEQVTTITLVLIIAITFEPLRKIITKLVHTVFISREKNAQEKAKRLQLLFSSTIQFDTLIEKSLSALESFLSVEQSNFMYRDLATQKMMASRKLDPQLDIEGVGYAYLTHKPEILVTEEIPYRMEEVGADEREQLQKIQPELQQAGISMVVPIGEPGELFGLFLFGQKARSAAFTADNIQYIKELQPHMTGAIANALMYKQAMERIGRK